MPVFTNLLIFSLRVFAKSSAAQLKPNEFPGSVSRPAVETQVSKKLA